MCDPNTQQNRLAFKAKPTQIDSPHYVGNRYSQVGFQADVAGGATRDAEEAERATYRNTLATGGKLEAWQQAKINPLTFLKNPKPGYGDATSAQADGSRLGTLEKVNGVWGRAVYQGRPQGEYGLFGDVIGTPGQNGKQALSTTYRKSDTRHLKSRKRAPTSSKKSLVLATASNSGASRRGSSSGLGIPVSGSAGLTTPQG